MGQPQFYILISPKPGHVERADAAPHWIPAPISRAEQIHSGRGAMSDLQYGHSRVPAGTATR